jgi:hypothetical protein
VKMFDSYGNVMVDISQLTRKNDDLILKGKMMGAMPGEFYIRPEEAWATLKLLSWTVIRYLPIMLIRGWRRSKPSN